MNLNIGPVNNLSYQLKFQTNLFVNLIIFNNFTELGLIESYLFRNLYILRTTCVLLNIKILLGI